MRLLWLPFLVSLATAASAPPPGTTTCCSERSERIVTAPGDTIAATEIGSGSPIVLVPGLLGGAFGYRKLVGPLEAAGYRLVIVMPLGMGASGRRKDADYTLEAQAARLDTALGRLGVEKAPFVCHAIGASICYRLALRSPKRVTGIVAINGGPAEQAGTSGLRSALRFSPLVRLFHATSVLTGKLRSGLRTSSADPSWVTDSVVAGYSAPFRRDLGAELDALHGMVSARDTARLAPRLARIQVPVWLVVGAGSRTAPIQPRETQQLRATLPDLTIDSVADAGQYVYEEDPAAVLAAIRALLRQVTHQVTPSLRSAPPRPPCARCAGSPC